MNNFNELNDKEFLETIILNKPILHQYINDSKGYIFHFLKKYEIYPSLEIFVNHDRFNPYSLKFIIDNYSLNNNDIHRLRPLFDEYIDNVISNSFFSEEEFLNYLINNKPLPSNVTLPGSFINNNKEELLNYINRNTSFYKNILFSLFYDNFSKFSKEEILSLPFEIKSMFFKQTYYLKQSFFTDKDIKNDCFNTILKNIKNAKEPSTITIDFNQYHVEQEDKDIILFFLTHDKKYNYLKDYDTYSFNIPGFSKLFTPYEFLTTINPLSFESFNLDDAKKHKKDIQHALLNIAQKDSSFNLLSYTKQNMKTEVFEEIIDLDFFTNFMTQFPNKDVWSFGKHDMEKKTHIYSLFLKQLKINPAPLFNYFNFHKFFKIILFEYEKEIPTSTFSTIAKHYLKTENFVSEHGKIFSLILDYLNRKECSLDMNSFFKENASVNLLYAIFDYYMTEAIDNNTVSLGYLEEAIKTVSQELHPEDVLPLEYLLNNPFITEQKNIQNKPNNFLNFNGKLPDNSFHLSSLLLAREEVRDTILTNNVILDNNIIVLLSEKLESQNIYDFFIKYIEKHKEILLNDNNFIALIIKNKELQNILPQYLDKNIQLNYYQNLKKCFYQGKDNYKDLIKLLSSDFLINYSKELVDNNNSDEYISFIEIFSKEKPYWLDDCGKYLIGHLQQLSYGDTLKFVNHDKFIAVLNPILKIGQNKKYVFNSKFKKEENHNIFNILEEQNKKLNTKNDLSIPELLFYFSDSSSDSLIKEVITKKYPSEILYNPLFSFEPSLHYSNRYVILSPYNSQEMYELFNNIEQKSDIFFCGNKSNYSFHSFIQNNFYHNEAEFIKLIDIAKNNNLKLYCLLSVFPNYRKFIDKNNYVELEEHKYLTKHFDLDLVIEGFKTIIDDSISKINNLNLQNKENEIFLHEVREFIKLFIANTYCSANPFSSIEYYSAYSSEQTNNILDILLKKCPFILYDYPSIGIYEKADSITIKKICENSNSVDNFFYLNSIIDNKKSDKIISIAHKVLDKLMDNDDILNIQYFFHTLKQESFFQYELKEENTPTKFSNVVTHITNSSKEEEFIQKISTFLNKTHLEEILNNREKTTSRQLKKI